MRVLSYTTSFAVPSKLLSMANVKKALSVCLKLWYCKLFCRMARCLSIVSVSDHDVSKRCVSGWKNSSLLFHFQYCASMRS